MSEEEQGAVTIERRTGVGASAPLTWRYLGERTAADAAYCIRFSVKAAPEPSEYAGVLSYAVPIDVPRR